MTSHPLAGLTAAQLKQAAALRGRIDQLESRLIKVLAAASAPSTRATGRRKPSPTKSGVRRRRKLSPEARARISAAATARWAKRKAAGKNRL